MYTSFVCASEFVRNQIIVGFEENSTEEGIGIIEDKIGLKLIKSIDRLDLALFSYDDNRTIEEIVSRCLLLEFVEFAEINSIVSFEGYGGGDPQFSNQWYLKGNFGINWEKVMDVWVPKQNVPVAVVDTGVNWMHPDLKNQIYEIFNNYKNEIKNFRKYKRLILQEKSGFNKDLKNIFIKK